MDRHWPRHVLGVLNKNVKDHYMDLSFNCGVYQSVNKIFYNDECGYILKFMKFEFLIFNHNS